MFGYVRQASGEPNTFIPMRRNSERNDAVYNINLRASKAFVLGHLSSKLFMTVDNLLNTDDLTIRTENRNLTGIAPPANPGQVSGNSPLSALQLDSERRFGRRFEV